MKCIHLLLAITLCLPVSAQHEADSAAVRSSLMKRTMDKVKDIKMRYFQPDSNYVVHSGYKGWIMPMTRVSFDILSPHFKQSDIFLNVERATLMPRPVVSTGVSVGFSGLALTGAIKFGLKNDHGDKRRHLQIQVMNSRFAFDAYRREMGTDFTIINAKLYRSDLFDSPNGEHANFLDSKMQGFDFAYVFNWRHFSYPAAYSKSYIQKKSAGSWIAGLGYMENQMKFDMKNYMSFATSHLKTEKIDEYVDELGIYYKENPNVDEESMTTKTPDIGYKSFYIMGGYSYNWVPARNWLISACGSVETSYKRHVSESYFYRFKGYYITPDFIARAAVKYNNGKWFAGMNLFANTNSYSDKRYSTFDLYTTVNTYVGVYVFKKKSK